MYININFEQQPLELVFLKAWRNNSLFYSSMFYEYMNKVKRRAQQDQAIGRAINNLDDMKI